MTGSMGQVRPHPLVGEERALRKEITEQLHKLEFRVSQRAQFERLRISRVASELPTDKARWKRPSVVQLGAARLRRHRRNRGGTTLSSNSSGTPPELRTARRELPDAEKGPSSLRSPLPSSGGGLRGRGQTGVTRAVGVDQMSRYARLVMDRKRSFVPSRPVPRPQRLRGIGCLIQRSQIEPRSRWTAPPAGLASTCTPRARAATRRPDGRTSGDSGTRTGTLRTPVEADLRPDEPDLRQFGS